MKEITESHIGEAVHFYLNEELITSPMITVVIAAENFIITGDHDKKTAEQFVDAINNQ